MIVEDFLNKSGLYTEIITKQSQVKQKVLEYEDLNESIAYQLTKEFGGKLVRFHSPSRSLHKFSVGRIKQFELSHYSFKRKRPKVVCYIVPLYNSTKLVHKYLHQFNFIKDEDVTPNDYEDTGTVKNNDKTQFLIKASLENGESIRKEISFRSISRTQRKNLRALLHLNGRRG